MNYRISTFSLSELTDNSDVIFPTTELRTPSRRRSVMQWLWNKTQKPGIALWASALQGAMSTWKENEDILWNMWEEGRRLGRNMLWRHHFTPLDTSQALIWLRTPASFVTPSSSFINELPDEVLVRIFQYVVHSDCTTPQDRVTKKVRYGILSGSSPTPPWLLGHVSSRWLQLVSSHPVLWSTIAICSPNEKHLAQAVYWLEKSKKCPLNISVEQYVSPNPICTAILHLLVAQAHRWRKVHLVLVDEAPFKRLLPGDMPMLEEFRVRARRFKASRMGRIFQVFHSSKALKHTNWGDSYSPSMVSHTPWTQLTSATLHCIEMTRVIIEGIASCSDTLLSLQLHNVRWMQDTASPLLMTRLEHLVCDYVHGGSRLFDVLAAPNLTSLQIAAHTALPWDSQASQTCVFTSAVAMMERSACRLKTFATNAASLPQALNLQPQTSVFHEVDTLSVHGHIEDEAILRRLSLKAETFPSLQHLKLENVETADGALAEVILSRGHQLRSVSVCLSGTHHRMDRAALGWMKNDGVMVAVHQPVSLWQDLGGEAEAMCRMFTDATPTLHFPEFERNWIL